MQIIYNMKEKCVWIITLFFLYLIITKSIDKSKKKRKTSHKYILLLNWNEMHKLTHKMVIQNQYKGGYGKEPFKGEQILYQNLYF